MASDGYITIHRTTDAAQGELLAEMLRREGIPARFHKVSSALIGLPTSMIEMTVEVPAESEERALELIADLEYAGAAESLERGEPVAADQPIEAEPAHDAPEDDDARDDAGAEGKGAVPPRGPGLSNRRPIFAAAFAVFVPGGAHLYARRGLTALVAATGMVGCFGIALTTRRMAVSESAFAVLIALVACDAIGGVRAARAEARGKHASRGRQVMRGLGLVGIAIALGAGARVVAEGSNMWQARQIEKYRLTCTDEAAIVVENHSGEAREIEIADVRVKADTPLGAESYGVGLTSRRFLTVASDGSVVVTPNIGEWIERTCKFPSVPAPSEPHSIFPSDSEGLDLIGPQPTSCGLVFSFIAREDGVLDGDEFRAIGTCELPRSLRSSTLATLQAAR